MKWIPFFIVSNLLSELRNDLKQVADKSHIGRGNNRSFTVGIYGNNEFGLRHAG